jgi:hypothetical protein
MNDLHIPSQLPFVLSSSRASVASTADQSHFARLLEGMRVASSPTQPGMNTTKTPGPERGEIGAALLNDVHGLDQIIEGMAVAAKLNSQEIQSNGDGDTYFMQTNYASQRATEFGEELGSLTRGRP